MFTQQYQRPQLATDWNKTAKPSCDLINTLDNGELVISTIHLATGLGVKHKSLIETIRTHLASIEQFGRVPFQTAPLETQGGVQQMTIAMLNENQALFVGSLSRNTVQVVAFKVTLVREFDLARKAVADLFRKQDNRSDLVPELTERLISLEAKLDRLNKSREKFYKARVVEKQKEKDDANRAEYETERDNWRIKFLMFMDRYCKYTYANPDRILEEVYTRLKTEYGIYLGNHQQRPGESKLDVAYRIGYGQQTWEILAYKLSSSAYITMPPTQS